MRIITFQRCAGKARACVESAGDHAHIAYLLAAVCAEGNFVLRATSGGCLVLCVASQVLRRREAH